jgi:hypothetical protein
MPREFNIPVRWFVTGYVTVKAEVAEEAWDKVERQNPSPWDSKSNVHPTEYTLEPDADGRVPRE